MTHTESSNDWTTLIAQTTPSAGAGPASSLVMPGTNAAAPAGTTTAPGTATPGQSQQPPGMGMIWMIGLALIVFMLVQSIFGSRRERRKREAMLSSLRKHDRVVTIGGMIGSIADIDDHEVVLRVDENSNTRVRFTRASIQAVLKSSSEPSAAPAQANGKVEVRPQGTKATV